MTTNHKGTQCMYKDILCQESFCEGCQIYLDRLCPVCKAHIENWRLTMGEEHKCIIKEVKE